MTYDQLSAAMKAGQWKQAYVFYGAEQFVKESAYQGMRKALLPDGLEALNETTLDAGASAQQIIEAAETLPMMCPRRLVAVRDWAVLLGGKVKDEAGESERMINWLANLPETCCLLFYFREQPDSRKKLAKSLQKYAEWIEFPQLNDAELAKWLNRPLRALGKAMPREAVERLTFMAGRSLTTLRLEVEKLSAYVGARTEITAEDVEAVVTPSIECTVFQMIDALMGGDMTRAHRLNQAMLEGGETRIGILAMLTRQLRMLTHLRCLRDDGMPLTEIERKLELNHYAATRTAAQAGRFSIEALEDGYRACVDTDYAIKSGRVRDVAGLDRLMLLLGDMTRHAQN